MTELLLLESLLDDTPTTTEPLSSIFLRKKTTHSQRRLRATAVEDDWSEAILAIKADPHAHKVALFWLKEALPQESQYTDKEFLVFVKFYWELFQHTEGRHSLDIFCRARLDRGYDETPATVGDLGVPFTEVDHEQIRNLKVEPKSPKKGTFERREATTPLSPIPKKKPAKRGKTVHESSSEKDEALAPLTKSPHAKKTQVATRSKSIKQESGGEEPAPPKPAHRPTKKRQKGPENDAEDVSDKTDGLEPAQPNRGHKKVKVEELPAPAPTERKGPRTKKIRRTLNKRKPETSSEQPSEEPSIEVPEQNPASEGLTDNQRPEGQPISPVANRDDAAASEPAPFELSARTAQGDTLDVEKLPVESSQAPPTTEATPSTSAPLEQLPIATEQPAEAPQEPIVQQKENDVAVEEEPVAVPHSPQQGVVPVSIIGPEVVSEIPEPETVVPQVVEPEAVIPQIVESELAPPQVTEPGVALPDIVESETALPQVAQPESVLLADAENNKEPIFAHTLQEIEPREVEPPLIVVQDGVVEISVEVAGPENNKGKKRKQAQREPSPLLEIEQEAASAEERHSKVQKIGQDDVAAVAIVQTEQSSEDVEMEEAPTHALPPNPDELQKEALSKKPKRKNKRAKPTSEEPTNLAALMNSAFGDNEDLNSTVDDDNNLLGAKPSSQDPAKRAPPKARVTRSAQKSKSPRNEEYSSGTPISPPRRSKMLVASPGPSVQPVSLEGNPPIWAVSRQEVCETFPQFRSYQGGVYFSKNIVKGYLLSGFGSSRDAFLHNGKLIISHGGGKSESQTFARGQRPGVRTAGDQRMDDTSVRCLFQNFKQRTPLVLLADDKYTKLPYNMAEREIGYVVLGFYVIQHVWSEQEKLTDSSGIDKFVVRYKFAFQWCESQGEPWWTLPPTETHDVLKALNSPKEVRKLPPVKEITVTQQEYRPQYPPGLYQTCKMCQEQSPQVYKTGWVCTNPSCDLFWEFSPENPFSHSPDLEFNPAFVLLLEMSALVRAPFPIPLRPPVNCSATSVLSSRGFHCRQCGRLSCRWKWQHWECSNQACKAIVPVKFELHRETHLRTPIPIPGDYRIPSTSGVDRETFQTFNCDGFKLHCQTFKFPNGGLVHQIRFKRYSPSSEPDDIFEEYQQQAADGTLPFRRWPLRTHKLKGSLLTNYFSVNCGEPYQYVGATEHTIPFESTPSAVMRARRFLTQCIKTAVGLDVEFNEVLSAAYMQEQRMAYHSDDEEGLQPVVAGLSLGAPALMHFRYKAKHIPDPKKKGVLATYVLRHGDILVMNGAEMQEYYEHTVEPLDFRIAATARTILGPSK